IIMRATLMNSLLCCFFMVLLGITFLSSASIENNEHSLDDKDYNSFYPVHAFDDRAVKSRFWKRAPRRHFWKRSVVEPSMQNDNTAKPVS
ncbi:unnamed protein product, partial [Rotaria magnacalcarata]